ncbi:hypothetical protein BDR03DRAFT_980870 [Suillus americanus]|nr:hypothetical protein BDR03DRAFT_980870 [Suillus americanus]
MYSNAFRDQQRQQQHLPASHRLDQLHGDKAFWITICNSASSSAKQSAYYKNIYGRMGCSTTCLRWHLRSVRLTPTGIYVTGSITYTQPNSDIVSPPYTAAIAVLRQRCL